MSDEIKVTVVEFSDRAHYQLQWRDPVSGKKKTKSSGIKRTGLQRERDAAEKAAGKLEAELREGRHANASKMLWSEFRERYEAEAVPGLAARTATKVSGVFNAVEAVLSPKRLRDLTASRLSHLQKHLRDGGRSEQTIKGHLAHLMSALQWAVRMGFLPAVPKVEKPKRARSINNRTPMKGRPITAEEFERMLDKVPEVLTEPPQKQRKAPKPPDPADVEAWRFYLNGLWLSGLRLAESLELTWDRPDRLQVELTGKRPMLAIPAGLEKGNRDRLLPMAPEFAEFLLAVPEARRTGFVFNPPTRRGKRCARLGELQVGRIVSAIGRAAKVKVNSTTKPDPETGQPVEVVKFASAHDLRRSFGERWAKRVMPQVLMELMRHESIETTLRYYVGRNAEATADILWEAHARIGGSNTQGNSGRKTVGAAESGRGDKSSAINGLE